MMSLVGILNSRFQIGTMDDENIPPDPKHPITVNLIQL